MSLKYKGMDEYQPQMNALREKYRKWKKWRSTEKTPFFILYKDFQETHLAKISGGAMKLYVFLGFNTNNFTGECWISVEQMAEFFGHDKRTVRAWFEELEELGLVTRIQTGFKRISNTFLLPYGQSPDDEDA